MANPSLAFAALADPTRREVFERLARGPRAVGELASELPVSRPAVSQHLKVLKAAGLVVDEAQGTRRVYEIDPNGLGAVRAWLDQFWGEALAAFKAEVERVEPTAEPATVSGAAPVEPDGVRRPSSGTARRRVPKTTARG
jgi:DNA-binding transcriptional ArsR family regulator